MDELSKPYTKQTAPPPVKALPAEARDLWIETFNGVIDAQGDDAEGVAFQAAWGNVRRKWKEQDGKWVAKAEARYTMAEPPDGIADLPWEARALWIAVFNESVEEHGEDAAYKKAWGSVGAKWHKISQWETKKHVDKRGCLYIMNGDRCLVIKTGKGPGRGWWGPPEGTHVGLGLLEGAVLEGGGTSMAWEDEETILGQAVITFDGNSEEVTDEQVSAFLQQELPNSGDIAWVDDPSQLEGVKITRRENGAGYVYIEVDITPTVEAGDMWQEITFQGEEMRTWNE